MRISRFSIYECILFHLYLLVYVFTFSRKDEWGPTVLLLVLTAGLIILELLRVGFLPSPLLIWYVFWVGVISVGRMDLNLYPFYQTWSPELLKVVVLNTLVFFWLFWLGELAAGTAITDNSTVFRGAPHGELTALLTLLLLAAGILAFAVNTVFTGVIPQLTGDANSYRQSFVTTPFYRIVCLSRVSFALVPPAVAGTKQRSMKTGILLLAAVLFFMEMLSGWRSYTLQAMVLLLTSLLLILLPGKRGSCKTNKSSLKMAFPAVLAAGVLAIVFIGYIAVTRDGVIGAFREKLNYLFYTLDMYIAPNFLNFQTGMNTVEPLGYPLYTSEAFWGLVTSWDALPPYPSIDQSIGAFNVSTYLLQPFADLGIPGTLLWSGIAGAAAGAVFAACRKKPSAGRLVLLGILNFAVLVMHNNFFFRASSTVLWILIGIGIDLLSYLRGGPEQMKG